MTTDPGALLRRGAPAGPWSEPDLHLFPQDGQRYEIVDGSLHVTPPPDCWHSSLVEAVVAMLRQAAPPGWWVCARHGVAIGDSHLIPDVTVLRPYSSGGIWSDPADVALVVEVETEHNRRYDRLLKPAVYAEAGIPLLWRIEDGPTLRAIRLDGHAPDQTVKPGDRARLTAPFPISIAPATWTKT